MTSRIEVQPFVVFLALFALVTVLGFYAAQWKRDDATNHGLAEWGLGGRQFGTAVTWFLIGGDFYTAYTIIAVPAAVYATGALGFFALPYTIIVYPFVFLVMPKLWKYCKEHDLVTSADFVKKRFQNRTLASLVAGTGVLALMPYTALQLIGMETVFAQMGLTGQSIWLKELPLTIAFAVLALYTYSAGLRAPAMIAFVKDIMIYIVVIALVVAAPRAFGGYPSIFSAATHHFATGSEASIILPRSSYSAYATLALGSALAAFMYPHTITSILASGSERVIRRNAVLLPAYTLLLGLIALLGIIGAASGMHFESSKLLVPAMCARLFPGWFAGFCFAAIAIAALVPAAIMSIAGANLFTRNLYQEFFAPNASSERQADVAKVVSIFIKFGALLFVFLVPSQYIINLQLLGGIWILQTLPSILLGLPRWNLSARSLIVGWCAGMAMGGWLTWQLRLASTVYTIRWGTGSWGIYIGLLALAANFGVMTFVLLLERLVALSRSEAGREQLG